MAFSSRRGRPKAKCTENTDNIDRGTYELQKKRTDNLTTELLDLLLVKSLISEEQHRAGIRFRWLYTIKFGVPKIAAVKYAKEEFFPRNTDSDWQAAMVAEYNFAAAELDALGLLKITQDIVIYQNLPLQKTIEILANCRLALSHLCKIWKKPCKK